MKEQFLIPAIRCCEKQVNCEEQVNQHSVHISGRDEQIFIKSKNPIHQTKYTLSDFQFEKCLHQGGASVGGRVYKAIHKQSQLCVVLKMFIVPDASSRIKVLIEREISIHSQLDHPHIIQLYAAFKEGLYIVLVLEYAEQGDLLPALHWNLTEHELKYNIVKPLILTLQHLHNNGIVHRDIKVENIFLDKEGIIRLGDFGLAIDRTIEVPKTPRVGTSLFMAPEVSQSKEKSAQHISSYNEKVDVYSLGRMILEFIQHNKSTQITQPFKDFIAYCLILDPNLRPSCSELLDHTWFNAMNIEYRI